MNKEKIIATAAIGASLVFGGIFFAMHSANAEPSAAVALPDVPVTTGSATSVTSDHATLRAEINAGGRRTNFWFEYGTDPADATTSPGFAATEKAAAGRGTKSVEFATDVSGLRSGTAYYFRAVSENASSTIRGDIAAFVTK